MAHATKRHDVPGSGQGLVPVVDVDPERCVNCHACIAACPVKFCNDGSGDHVSVDPDLCIGCGSCMAACQHEARHAVDDSAAFFDALDQGEPLVVMIAPSAAASFPGHLPHLNGWLTSRGIQAVFDVSFGAELSTRTYVHLLQTSPDTQTVIAQPCPAMVSYLQIYRPELLSHLAAAHSPMACCAIMIREFYPEYANCRIAAISPCLAKRREFAETGRIEFNVGYTSLNEYLQRHHVQLQTFPEVAFTQPPAERGVRFPQPGGLTRTLARWMPEIPGRTRRIEGKTLLYPYLDHLHEVIGQGKASRLVDCLNCELGCVCGPLTLVSSDTPDLADNWVDQQDRQQRAHYATADGTQDAINKLNATIETYWKPELYIRTYAAPASQNPLRIPSDAERTEILHRMHKTKPEDLYNCCACGYFSCEGMVQAIHNGKNRPENCHFFLQTERMLAHTETQTKERFLRTIIETSAEGFLQVDNDFRIVRTNPAVSTILGYSGDELIGRSMFDLIDADNRDTLRRQQQLRENQESSVYELAMRHKNGSVRYCLISASPLNDEGQTKIGSFGMVTDITEQKRVEQEIRLMERYLKNIIDSMPASLVAVNDKGTITAWNLEAEKRTGISSDAACGKPLVEVYELLADQLPRIQQAIAERLPQHVDKLLRIVGGEQRFHDVMVYPLIANGACGAVILVDDVTEKVRLQNMMVQTEKMMSVGGLAAGMAHEINNPLGGIMQGAQNILRRVSLELPKNREVAEACGVSLEAVRAYLEQRAILRFLDGIRDAGEKAGRIISNMLQFSRQGDARPQPVPLHHLLDQAVELGASDYDLKKQYDFKLVNIERDYAPDVPPVCCISGEIEQVLLNILKNAAQAMHSVPKDERPAPPTLWLSTSKDNGFAVIKIRDNGPGMDEPTLQHCMDPFFTTKEVGVGTGLGLSVSYFIIHNNHGGEMQVESAPGQGTTFSIRLPLTRSHRHE